MLHFNIVPLKTIITEKRLDPKYFRFNDKRKELIEKSSMNFHKIGDKLVTKMVTDGEHQAINLYKKGNNAEIRYLYVHNIKEGTIDLNDAIYIKRSDHERLERSKLEMGNILLTIVGTIGKSTMVYDYLGEANIPRNISKIIVNEDNLLPEFLTAFFLSQFGREQSFYSSGGNLQGLLSLTKLKKMFAPLPDIKIQKKIGNVYLEALECESKSLGLLKIAKEYFYKKLDVDFSKIEEKKHFSTNSLELSNSDTFCPLYRYPKYVEIEKIIRSKWKTLKIGEKEVFDLDTGNEVGSANYNNFIFKKADYIPFIRTSDMVNYEIDQDPDYHIPHEIYEDLNQNINVGDVLFTKDGKIGMSAMITKNDKAIISSGILRIRLKKEAEKYNLSPEYLFLVLSLKETGLYPALRRTVIASTIPHLRVDRIKEIEIPLINEKDILHISKLVKDAFKLKNRKKILLKRVKDEMDKLLDYD